MKRVIKTLFVSAAVCGLFAMGSAQAAQYTETSTHNTTQTQLSRAKVMQIQRKLAKLDFYKGPKDGSWGAGTTDAVKSFQNSRGFAESGMPTAETLTALGVTPTSRGRTITSDAATEISPTDGGAVYQENSVESDSYTTRSQRGILSVESANVNGSTCLTCTNGIYGTGDTANMHSNEY